MKLLLIDGNSIINRAYYGIRPLSTTTGIPTNALFGFLNILIKHISEEKPDMCAVAFDLKEKTFRHKRFSEYKGTRSAMPEDLAAQMPLAKELLDALKICRVEKAGIEADDIIGILSQRVSDAGGTCVIVTGDRDSLQLVSDSVTVKLAVKNEDILFTPDAVKEKYGLIPAKLTDLKGLMGDTSDNIPGVKGVGEKTAESLLIKYGSLDGVYEHADELKGSLSDKIKSGREDAYMSKFLGTILREGDLTTSFDDMLVRSPDESKLDDFLRKTEMVSFRRKFDFLSGTKEAEVPEEKAERIPFDVKSISGKTVYMLYTEEEFLILADNGSIMTLPVSDIDRFPFSEKNIVTHNAKSLLRLLYENSADTTIEFDTMLAGYILDATRSSYPLDLLCGLYLNISSEDDAVLLRNLPGLKSVLEEKMDQNGQTGLYKTIELPLCPVLARMENEGFAVDCDFLKRFSEEASVTIDSLKQKIYDCAGHEFNINSTQQIGAVLYEELGLPKGKKTKSGYSTNSDELEKLRRYHPIADLILEYRKIVKLKSTYADGLLKKTEEDGRIHTSFTQTVTATGRISSVEPNLQNIPIRTEIGKQFRHAFIPRSGWRLIDADYSQIELRILAHCAKDETMINAFANGTDIHTLTASEIFGLPIIMVSPEMRSRAKAVNFGIVYGIGEFSLAKDLGISRKEAGAYIQGYLNTYSGVRKYMDDITESAKANGYVETLFGRRRYIPEINSKNAVTAALGKRLALNTPIQGTAADIIKTAMIRVDSALRKANLKAKLILQVHDELIVEAPPEEEEAVMNILKNEMERAADLSVNLLTEVGNGKDWFEAH